MSLHTYDPNTKELTLIAGTIPPMLGYTPVGTIISVMATEAPEFYLKCDGSTHLIAEYPELAKHITDNFGSVDFFGGDGTTTFAVPDLRGEFLRGTGTNSHANQGSGANVGVHQDGTEHVWYTIYDMYVNYPKINNTSICTSNADSIKGTTSKRNYGQLAEQVDTENKFFTSRPTNTSVLYCIATKNIYISLDDERPIQAAMDRWLRFDPTNKKGLIIKAGTSILKSNKYYKTFHQDTKIDFSSTITGSDNGKDFFVYLLDDDSVIASNSKLSTGVEIGRFHTLCASAGANLTMTMPASPSSGLLVGDRIQVKPYRMEMDLDFYSFYNKTITAVSAGTPYDVITCEHPLKGYEAGDILPESVFCKTFYPETFVDDAMVYDVATDLCVDIYLQSGTGINTRSVYNATHTVNRQAYNHQGDMLAVGKQLLSDHEFTSIALGSNEGSAIQGASDKTTVGGHVDTAGRRMISAIGCEECCGYLWQWLSEVGFNGQSGWKTTDGRGSFGQEYGEPYVLLAGGDWASSGSCGSRARLCSAVRSGVNASCGGRGRKPITKSAGAPKTSMIAPGMNYSTEEQVVGTWIGGKPLYQKTISMGALKNKASTIVNHNISNVDRIVYLIGYTYNPTNGWMYPITRGGFGSYDISANANDTVVEVGSNADLSEWTETYVTIQYTKTT